MPGTWRCVRNLGQQLVGHRLSEGTEIQDLQHKGARAANDVISVIVRQAAGWVRVHVAEAVGLAAKLAAPSPFKLTR